MLRMKTLCRMEIQPRQNMSLIASSFTRGKRPKRGSWASALSKDEDRDAYSLCQSECFGQPGCYFRHLSIGTDRRAALPKVGHGIHLVNEELLLLVGSGLDHPGIAKCKFVISSQR